jgi:hypothetical protein
MTDINQSVMSVLFHSEPTQTDGLKNMTHQHILGLKDGYSLSPILFLSIND